MESIDDALAGLPQPEHDALQRVIDLARRVAPHAIDGVSYGVPALKVAGKPLIGVSASAHHLSIFPFSPAAIDRPDRARWFLGLEGHDPVHCRAPGTRGAHRAARGGAPGRGHLAIVNCS